MYFNFKFVVLVGSNIFSGIASITTYDTLTTLLEAYNERLKMLN